MCGRFTLFDNKEVIEDEFDVEIQPDLFNPSYNISPTQKSLVIYTEADKRICAAMRWGLVPFWSKDINIGYKMINARAETVDEKTSFKKPLKDKRCLVLTNGFYEWKKVDAKTKIPYFIRLRNKKPFTFAGLWEYWSDEDDDLHTFTIITTSANSLMKDIHDRMPVILDKEVGFKWLDPDLKNTAVLKDLLIPFPSKDLEAYEISTLVNSAKNNSQKCINPIK